MFKRPLFVIALPLVTGIASAILFDLSQIMIFFCGMILCLVLALKKKKIFFIFLFFIFFVSHLISSNQLKIFEQLYTVNEKEINVSGKILKIDKKENSRYVFLENVRIDDTKKTTDIVVILSDRMLGNTDLKSGNKITVYGKFSLFEKASNRGNFDSRNYYLSEGYGGKIFAEKLYLTSSSYNIINESLFNIKNKLAGIYSEIPFKDTSGLFKAITLGDKSGISDEYKSIYQEAGIAHVLAISGLHISFLGMSIFKLLRKIIRFRYAASFSFIVLICFLIMSGMHVSGLRAVIMFAVNMIAVAKGKNYDLLSSLSFACILILLKNPFYIFNTAFLLSFGAIFALVLWDIYIQRFYSFKNKSANNFCAGITVTFITFPVIAYLYHQIPLYGIFINLIVIPLMTPVLGSAVVGGLLGFINTGLSEFIMSAGVFVATIIEYICKIFLNLPHPVLITGQTGVFKISIYYLISGLFISIIYINLNSKRECYNKKINLLKNILIIKDYKFRKKIITGIIFLFVLVAVISTKPLHKGLGLYFFDVGQGDGILIKKDNSLNIMVDGGSGNIDNIWKYRLEDALKYKGVTKIDYWIITHPDKDHISGLIEALEDNYKAHIQIKNILIPDVKDNENEIKMIKKAKLINIPVIFINKGVEINGELNIRFLHPDKNFESVDANSYSATFELEYNGFKAVFTGDIGNNEEKLLVDEGLLSDSILLKVAHHGSKNSTSNEFLSEVKPEIAIISSGKNNLYGHPHVETLNKLKDYGAQIYNTSDTGEIDIEFNEDKLNVLLMK